jgi:hypothetical protein
MKRVAVAAAAVAVLAVIGPVRATFADQPVVTASMALDRLDKPGGLSVTGVTTATITWQPIADTYGQGYRLYRSTTSGTGYTQVRAVTPISASTTSDTPLVPGRYYYVIRAYAGEWLSAPSNEVSVLLL